MGKHFFLPGALVLLMLQAAAQNVGINTDGSKPNPNAILDVKSSNKGLLIPRMTTEIRRHIANTRGLLVYDITTDNFWYNTGSEWKCIPNDDDKDKDKNGKAWLITGNNNTKDKLNFLGTINNVPLNIRVNNQPSGRIDSANGNAFWGYLAAPIDSLGFNNTAIGAFSLRSNTNGYNNVANGTRALEGNIGGIENTANGCYALQGNGGNENTATGTSSIRSNTIGFNNVAAGAQSMYFNTTGFDNVAIGFQALFTNTTSNTLTATGTQALYSNSSGQNNVADGYQALYSNTSGIFNTATGVQALYANIDGFENEANGTQALNMNTHGGWNTANGSWALLSNTIGFANTANGARALNFSSTGSSNTANGAFALYRNTIGHSNSGNGAWALYSNINGYNNTANGDSSLLNNTTGFQNTADGGSSLNANISGSYNTAIGYQADASTGNLTNATTIGYGSIVDASNKVRIGNSAVTVIEGQVPFTTPSDGRYKFNVKEDVKGLDFILQLRPITYQFDTKRFDAQMNHLADAGSATVNYAMQASYDAATRIRRSGFIAQEVERAAEATGYDFSGIIKPRTEQDHYSLSYDAFVVPLVKAVQEQQQVIGAQNKKLAEQEKMNSLQDKKIEDLQRQLDEIRELLQHPH